MKTIATVATALLLSLGLFIAPANAADETAPTPGCDEALDTARLLVISDHENATLKGVIAAVRTDLEKSHADVVQRSERILTLDTRLANKQATIDRLRAELRKR